MSHEEDKLYQEDPIKYLANLVSRHNGDLLNLWGAQEKLVASQKKISRDMAVYVILLTVMVFMSVVFSAANYFAQ